METMSSEHETSKIHQGRYRTYIKVLGFLRQWYVKSLTSHQDNIGMVFRFGINKMK
jgi:hypothetical protein